MAMSLTSAPQVVGEHESPPITYKLSPFKFMRNWKFRWKPAARCNCMENPVSLWLHLGVFNNTSFDPGGNLVLWCKKRGTYRQMCCLHVCRRFTRNGLSHPKKIPTIYSSGTVCVLLSRLLCFEHFFFPVHATCLWPLHIS